MPLRFDATMVELRNPKLEPLRSVTSIIVESQRPAYSLRPQVLEMTTILTGSGSIRDTGQQDISGGESRTSNGLALSPKMAAMCADDFVRTIQFIRGLRAAIVDVRKRYPDRPVRVLYVGCGPCATLAVPLMALFSPKEATFTLLDIHRESIESVKSIVGTLGLTNSVTKFETQDASSYRVDPERPPDVILLEVMQACLDSEPQVAITRHLVAQAPNAVLIPEEVRVDLTLVDPSSEFDVDHLGRGEGAAQRDRIPVTSVFVVNRKTVDSWKGNCSNLLPGSAGRLPDSMEQRYQPMLFTTIRVYKNHILKDYDSGLTCPKRLSIEGSIKAGDTIQFHYELGQQPRLRSTNKSHHDRIAGP
jgi:hypothetical protein